MVLFKYWNLNIILFAQFFKSVSTVLFEVIKMIYAVSEVNLLIIKIVCSNSINLNLW